MALELVALIRGDYGQDDSVIEYDPQPPCDSGSRRKATAEQLAAVQQRLVEIYAQPVQ